MLSNDSIKTSINLITGLLVFIKLFGYLKGYITFIFLIIWSLPFIIFLYLANKLSIKSYQSFSFILLIYFLNNNNDLSYILIGISILTNLYLLFNLLMNKSFRFKKIPSFLLLLFHITLSLFFLFQLPILNNSYEPTYILFLLIIVWTSDSAGYFFGIKYGKRKLMKSISPKKTVEGFVASLFFSMIISLIFGYIINYKNLIEIVVIGFFVSVFWLTYLSQIGFLFYIEAIGTFFGPLFGVMIADFYFIKKESLNNKDIYSLEQNGSYYYSGGWHIKGVYALFLGFIFSVSTIWNNNLMFLESYSWIIGAIVSFVVYYLLAKD